MGVPPPEWVLIGDGMGCLDDVPVKHQLPLLTAGAPTKFEDAQAHPCWRHPDLGNVRDHFLLQALQGMGEIAILEILLDPY